MACVTGHDVSQSLVVGLADDVHSQGAGSAAEYCPVGAQLRLVRRAAVVEARRDVDVKAHLAPHAAKHPDQSMPVGGHLAADRHEVIDLTYPRLTEESGDQNGCVRQIHLLGIECTLRRPDAKVTAPTLVEQRPEDAGRVEPRSAEPVDRAIGRDERSSLQITDQAVLCDERVIIHGDPRGWSVASDAAARLASPDHRRSLRAYWSSAASGEVRHVPACAAMIAVTPRPERLIPDG